MIAVCTIRNNPHYRRDAFIKGLTRAGYRIVERGRPTSRHDVLCMWNRQGAAEATANTWETCGGTVLIAENGYLGKDPQGLPYYAIAVHGHNGSGWFPIGDEDRFAALNIDLAPWHTPEAVVLVCGQRGIGSKLMASPHGWDQRIAQRIRVGMNRKVRLRRHPGLIPQKTTLEQDLSDAGCCVIWSSSSGVRALVMGVPVIYAAPHWIGAECALKTLDGLANPKGDDAARLAAMRTISWGQRSVAEIETGEVFVRIRERIGEARWT